MMADLFARASRLFRARRMRHFAALFSLDASTRILDIGGTPYNWSLLDAQPKVTLLNIPRAEEPMHVAADGCRLPFRDAAFDIVFSNSVIEHLRDAASQRLFASEVQRVGRRYFVQTPNRWFPIETHLLTPLVHWLPKAWQSPIVKHATVWALCNRVSADRREFYLNHYLQDVLLLDADAMRRLFPGARVERERFWGFTKSLIAVK